MIRAFSTGLIAAVALVGVGAAPSYAGPAAGGVVICDVNGDEISDIVFEGTLSGTPNLVAIWTTANIAIQTGGGFANAAGYDVHGCGKFDAGATEDLVMYNASTGDVTFFYMNGLAVIGGSSLGNIGANQPWIVTDLNNNGSADIITFNPATSDITAILVTNGLYAGGGLIGTPVGWTPVTAGDFNGDGQKDLLLVNGTTQQFAIWLLNNLQIASGTGDALPAGFSFLENSAGIDGNLTDDIGLRDNAGNNYWWLVNFDGPGNTFQISGTVVLGNTGTNTTVAVANLNNDTDPDVLLQDPANGNVSGFVLNAGAFASGGFIGGPLKAAGIDFDVVNNGPN